MGRLRNRFKTHSKWETTSSGVQYKSNYNASDFKLSCGITLAKFEKQRCQI
ncbi:hypothetical protein ELAK_06460 [Elizabethkingia anophelis]|nr:hypothetical protein ELAK_06460 [Elizabethkingia anophelis]